MDSALVFLPGTFVLGISRYFSYPENVFVRLFLRTPVESTGKRNRVFSFIDRLDIGELNLLLYNWSNSSVKLINAINVMVRARYTNKGAR